MNRWDTFVVLWGIAWGFLIGINLMLWLAGDQASGFFVVGLLITGAGVFSRTRWLLWIGFGVVLVGMAVWLSGK